MNNLTYKFTIVEFHMLIRLIESCRPEIASAFQELEKLKAELDENKNLKIEALNQALEGFLGALIQSEDHCYVLLASSIGKEINDIKAMKPAQFIKALKGLFDVIEWHEILGEIMALIPEGKIKERIRAYQKEVKEKLKEQTSNNSNSTSID